MFPHRIILSFIILLHTAAAAQDGSYIFRHITEADGLAGHPVTGILQDDRGFMWFATQNGLQKYDGYGFTTYHYDPNDPQSLSSDEVGFLLRDKEHHLWVLTNGGYNRLDLLTGKNARIAEFNAPDLKKLNSVVAACLDEKGNTWFISNNSLGRYDLRSHQMISCEKALPKEEDKGFTRTILCDPRTGHLWINSARYGVCMYDPIRNEFYYRLHNPEHLPVLSIPDRAGTMFLDRENNLWVNNYSSQLYRCDLSTGKIRNYSLGSSLHAACFLEDKRGTIWIGTGQNGLLQYSRIADSFRIIGRNRISPATGPDYEQTIFCLFEDREGKIWIGTDKGVDTFNPYARQFVPVEEQTADNDHRHANMSFLETKNGDIWVASYERGIRVYDRQYRFIKNYVHDVSDPYALKESSDRVWSFLPRPDGTIWVGSQRGWLSVFDPASGRFIRSFQPPALEQNTIERMVSDKEQNIWMCLYSGIAKYDARTGIFTHYEDFLPYRSSTRSPADDIAIDSRNNLWVGTLTNGLQKFDPVAGKFTEIYVPRGNDPHSISSKTVLCLAGINDSMLAVGTSEGIDLFNTRSRQFNAVRPAGGLPVYSVAALCFQAPSTLWAATNQGIYKLNLADDRVTLFGREDGILNNDFSECMQFYKMHDGKLLIGYRGGFLRFNPDSIKDRPAPAAVSLTGCSINGQPVSIDSILNGQDRLSLSYAENFITIQYASLSYRDPNATDYFYRLDGIDKDWIKAGAQRLAAYSKLAPGAYTFSVKCESNGGIPCEGITDLPIIIYPPFWQTWWFKSLVVVTIGLLLYGFYRYRINQLMALQAVRNKISRDIHDDVGATLSSISILSEVAKNKIEQGQQDQSYSLLTRISSNSRETVEKMSDIIWSIKPNNDNIGQIIQRLKNFALETCTAGGIRLQFMADDRTGKLALSMEQTKNVYLICKEGVNNAIKHARCDQITVSFLTHSSELEISILDNGRGFDPQASRQGNGLLNMRQRAMEIKGTLVVQTAGGQDAGAGGCLLIAKIAIP